MLKQKIIKRLINLRNWELVNIFFLPLCLYVVLKTMKVQNWQPYAYSLFIICTILMQGVLYWHLKLQTIRNKDRNFPSYFYPLFTLFKRINIVLLSVYPILVLCNCITTQINFLVSFWSNALFLFAVLEYINYYHFQLSHDNINDIRYLLNFKKIRRSHLYVDLQKNQR